MKLYLETNDYRGQHCIFTQAQVDSHIHRRPELRDPGFKSRIIAALQTPDIIYPDYAKRKRHVYYRKEYQVNGVAWYVKVVVQMSSNPCFIVTAFRPNNIKEANKGLSPIYERAN